MITVKNTAAALIPSELLPALTAFGWNNVVRIGRRFKAANSAAEAAEQLVASSSTAPQPCFLR